MSARRKEPPATLRVFELLVARTAAGEFTTVAQIVAATGVTRGNAMSALWMLQHAYAAVDAVAADGTLHWFATPETDRRQRHVRERALETKPRRPGRRPSKKGETK